MAANTIVIAGTHFSWVELTLATVSQQSLDAEATLIYRLFLEREIDFGYGPDIVLDTPTIDSTEDSPFLADPLRYIAARCAVAAGDVPVGKVVILTTYADLLHAPLVGAGYQSNRIDMPAGPDNTGAFTLELSSQSSTSRTLYLEAVNESDDKIRPAFVLKLIDAAGQLKGGACGSIHERDGRRYAYLATLVVDSNLPPTTGACLAQEMLRFLAGLGVQTIHLGTQTAGPFYEKLGFRISHRLIAGLRHRTARDGSIVWHDLVMMRMDLPPGVKAV